MEPPAVPRPAHRRLPGRHVLRPAQGSAPPPTEGERWTEERLNALRDARFAPAALRAFLGAALRRSGQARAARPQLAAQSRRWMAVGALAWAAPALAGVEPFRRCARGGLAWWGLTSLMLDWHLGMLETPEGEPRPLGPADAATLARAWLVPVVAADPRPLFCIVGAASDAVDGRLARATAPTRAGRDLEGMVDACFEAAALTGLRRADAIGRPAAVAEAARVAAGLLYTLHAYFGTGRAPAERIVRSGRVTAPVRMAGVAAAAAGRRRAGTILLGLGSAVAIADVAAALSATPDGRRRARPAPAPAR